MLANTQERTKTHDEPRSLSPSKIRWRPFVLVHGPTAQLDAINRLTTLRALPQFRLESGFDLGRRHGPQHKDWHSKHNKCLDRRSTLVMTGEDGFVTRRRSCRLYVFNWVVCIISCVELIWIASSVRVPEASNVRVPGSQQPLLLFILLSITKPVLWPGEPFPPYGPHRGLGHLRRCELAPVAGR